MFFLEFHIKTLLLLYSYFLNYFLIFDQALTLTSANSITFSDSSYEPTTADTTLVTFLPTTVSGLVNSSLTPILTTVNFTITTSLATTSDTCMFF